MSDKEQATATITRYMNLLRIQAAKDPEAMKREVKNQICETKAQLEALGIVADNLVIE